MLLRPATLLLAVGIVALSRDCTGFGEDPSAVTRLVGAVLTSALDQHWTTDGAYPDSLPAVCPGVRACGRLGADPRPVDGWGRTFHYERDGALYRLTSVGPDGKIGTTDDVNYSPAERLHAAGGAAGCWALPADLEAELGLPVIRLDSVLHERGEFTVQLSPRFSQASWTPWSNDSVLISFIDKHGLTLRARVWSDSLAGEARKSSDTSGRTKRLRFSAARSPC